jgi:hypothetical protein
MKQIDRLVVSPSSAAILAATILLLAACGGGGGSTPDAAFTDLPSARDCGLPTIDDSVAKPTCTNKAVVADVTEVLGTWVARVTAAQIVNAPVVGIMHNQYILTMLVNFTQRGTEVVADGRNCDRQQVNEPNAAAPVVIPEIWAHTETPVHRTGTFAVGAEGYPILHLRASTEIIGAKLASPLACLPEKSTEDSVYDQDADGKPGITVALTGQSLAGTISAVQSQTTVINAVAVSADRFEGDLRFIAQQNVLESSPATLGVLYSMGSTGPDPVLCNSGFTMVKISDVAGTDGGATTCAWVREKEAELFQ